MEENNEQQKIENPKCYLDEHRVLKHVLAGLLIFLGAFCAFYVVADWHFKRMISPIYQMRKIDRDFMKQERKFNDMARDIQKQMPIRNNAQFIHVEQLPDAYRINIDLKPFDNDEKNIEVRTEGKHILIIDAAGEKNSKNKKEIVKYSQTFSFGEEIDTNEITKVREGNNYIITVPVD